MVNRISLQALIGLFYANDIVVDITPLRCYKSLRVVQVCGNKGNLLYDIDSQSILQVTEQWGKYLTAVQEKLKDDENKARHPPSPYELRADTDTVAGSSIDDAAKCPSH